MPSVCLILKVHEPHRLRHYSFFDIGESPSYADDVADFAHLDKVTRHCYLPATRILLKQIKEYKKDFRFSILLSGVAIDQFERFQPELLAQFKQLAETGCVEFICEPYFHSLAFIFSKPEFREQVELHQQKLKSLFGQTPATFHYHALGYNNDIAHEADALGFKAMLATGADHILGGRSLNRLYESAPHPALKLLLENPLLTDNIARFSSASGLASPPLNSSQFMSRLIEKQGEIITLTSNLNTFEEHPLGEAGALEFLSQFPCTLLSHKGYVLETPAQAVKTRTPCGTISIPGFKSWEEAEQESQDWLGNEMQKDAIHGLYLVEQEVKQHPDPTLLLAWRNLQVSDHFLYMNTKQLTAEIRNGDVSPYHSPYDAYINFMNILTDFTERLAAR
jgi:alpha-amylase